jgi:hypothetical protein
MTNKNKNKSRREGAAMFSIPTDVLARALQDCHVDEWLSVERRRDRPAPHNPNSWDSYHGWMDGFDEAEFWDAFIQGLPLPPGHEKCCPNYSPKSNMLSEPVRPRRL